MRRSSWPTTARPTTPRGPPSTAAPSSCARRRRSARAASRRWRRARCCTARSSPIRRSSSCATATWGRAPRSSAAWSTRCAADECDLAVAVFARKVGGGFGFAVGFAHWAIQKLTGLDLKAPISGQRAMRGEVLPVVVPFAHDFGMEIGMTVDAARAGFRVGRGRARPRPPRHRPQSAGVPPPRPPAQGLPAGLSRRVGNRAFHAHSTAGRFPPQRCPTDGRLEPWGYRPSLSAGDRHADNGGSSRLLLRRAAARVLSIAAAATP